MKYTKEQFKEKYKNLPPAIIDFMSSQETTDKILAIGDKYNFHIDQLSALSEEVSLILVGLERLQDFHSNLQKSIGISEDIANLIIYDLNREIFSKIREELMKIESSRGNTSSTTSSPQQMFEEKMGGVSNVPKQEVEVKAQTGDNKEAGASVKPPRDPYREPIV